MTALDPREELAQRLGLAEVPKVRFESPADVRQRLSDNDYLSDDSIASVTYLADRLAKPVLVEGPAGTGKTALAKAVADSIGARLIRLQCYEGLDDSKALYEWNYRKQLLRIQAGRPEGSGTEDWGDLEEDIFGEEFLLTRPKHYSWRFCPSTKSPFQNWEP
jgi:MoxR-like ATPase